MIRTKDAPYWLFASHDVALRKIAEIAFSGAIDDKHRVLRFFLESCWGRTDGRRLFNMYVESSSAAAIGSVKRRHRTETYFASMSERIIELEKLLAIDSVFPSSGQPSAAVEVGN